MREKLKLYKYNVNNCQFPFSCRTPSVVADDECFSTMGPKPPAHQKCNVGSPCPTWHVGPWNPVSLFCFMFYFYRIKFKGRCSENRFF